MGPERRQNNEPHCSGAICIPNTICYNNPKIHYIQVNSKKKKSHIHYTFSSVFVQLASQVALQECENIQEYVAFQWHEWLPCTRSKWRLGGEGEGGE